MSNLPGDKTICQICTERIEFDGSRWLHIGLPYGVQPQHTGWPREPVPDLDNPAWANGVVLEHKDAPEDEAEDRILVESGILPKLIDAAMSEAPSGKPWQQELAEIDKPAISHADAAHTLGKLTEQIAGILGCCGRSQDLCEMDAQLIRHVWANALRTTTDAA